MESNRNVEKESSSAARPIQGLHNTPDGYVCRSILEHMQSTRTQRALQEFNVAELPLYSIPINTARFGGRGLAGAADTAAAGLAGAEDEDEDEGEVPDDRFLLIAATAANTSPRFSARTCWEQMGWAWGCKQLPSSHTQLLQYCSPVDTD